jgi:hypothetical protein
LCRYALVQTDDDADEASFEEFVEMLLVVGGCTSVAYSVDP